ncbi:MAG: phosphatidate cytidylyltransferase [Clostridia bacterium]|nr:phosphatidate cytidylyltransferase [Clostridia bacterium]
MKTRIISGIVMGVIVACVLAVGFLWDTAVITVALALLAAVAIYELLHNAAKIDSKYTLIGAVVYVFLNTLLPLESPISLYSFVLPPSISYKSLALGVLYFIFAAVGTLKNNKNFSLGHICASCFGPMILSTAFVFLNFVIISRESLYYLLLLFNFSSVCDMGAYFSGVTLGKHKLCPTISPKKTVEGAVGGILSSIVVTLILSLCFKKAILLPMLLTVPFCILGMIGDLFASAIKRSVDLKDYGNLIPGHGGILDRLDSILMISPLLAVLMAIGII